MRRARFAVAFLVGGAVLSPVAARAEQQPSELPGQPGGDPAPDTQAANDLLHRGRYEDAITAAKRSLSRDERYVPAMLVMARAYYYLKKYELATAIIDIAKSIDANSAEEYQLLGFLALTHDDRISATAAFKRATELKDNYPAAWNNLAAQYLQAKNYDAAVDAAEHATRRSPNWDKAWLNLGSAYRGKQRYEEAETAYRKALALNASYADAYFNLGILYLDAPQMPNVDLSAKLNTAINHLTKYKELSGPRLTKDDPADSYVEQARKAIEREQKRLERVKKQQERDKAKAAPPADKAKAAPPADKAKAAPLPGGGQ